MTAPPPDPTTLPYWMTLSETAALLRISPRTLYSRCAERVIDKKCGHKIGHVWRFKRDVLLRDGLILTE